MKRVFTIICLLSFISIIKSQTEVKIMYYNILNFGGNDTDRLDEMRTVFHYDKPAIFVVNELESSAAGNNILTQVANYYDDNYEFAQFTNGPDTDNGFFYDADIFTLIDSDIVQTDLRYINMYKVRHVANQDTVEMEFYSCHLKASSGSENVLKREQEARDLKAYIGDLSMRENVFIGGDFNFYNAAEGGFRVIIDEIGMKDPLGQTQSWVDWHTNPAYAQYHTQSPRTTQFGGGANGGMDDRFDFIFVSEDVIQGNNNAVYLFDTYKALGNDGLHYNDAITSLPVNQLYPETLITALHDLSDHIPVMMTVELFPENPSSIQEELDVEMKVYYQAMEVIVSTNSGLSYRGSYELYDSTGRVVFQEDRELFKGLNTLNIPRNNLAKGTYVLVEKISGIRTKLIVQ